MTTSRDLADLLPEVAARAREFLAAAAAEGIDLLVTCTYRDAAAQAALYAQGRTAPGLRVTNARPGESWHNWRRALDVVPLRNGKPVWTTAGPDAALWARVGELGEASGLEWAGRWRGSLREMAHFQYTGGLTLAQVQEASNGKVA